MKGSNLEKKSDGVLRVCLQEEKHDSPAEEHENPAVGRTREPCSRKNMRILQYEEHGSPAVGRTWEPCK
jgi:hypothetical protein